MEYDRNGRWRCPECGKRVVYLVLKEKEGMNGGKG